MSMSALDGSGSPEGCACNAMTALAWSSRQRMQTSRG